MSTLTNPSLTCWVFFCFFLKINHFLLGYVNYYYYLCINKSSMKGIVEQMRDSKHVIIDGKFDKKDFDKIIEKFKIAQEEDVTYRSDRMKELKENEKHILKRSKELNKEIPLELAYHCYISFNKTYVDVDFVNKYKEWF